ncbi:hypothetical protein ACFFX0_02850 [Citricoccus parietis]|uniref:Uncharacterized protein n=1 Tax=Citricoccus parietis TaxID=592307 RepID=A0ABV5FV77_9MICC
MPQGASADLDVTGGGRDQSGHDAQQRCLAAARTTDQGDELLLADVQVDVGERVGGPAFGLVGLAESGDPDLRTRVRRCGLRCGHGGLGLHAHDCSSGMGGTQEAGR